MGEGCTKFYICSGLHFYLSFSAMTQSFPLDVEPHVQSGVSWERPKLCPISWAIVEARPIGFSLWSWRRKMNQYHLHRPSWWTRVRHHYSHLIHASRVSGAHGELICQSDCFSFKISPAVKDKNAPSGQAGGIAAVKTSAQMSILTSQTGRCRASPSAGGRPDATPGTCPAWLLNCGWCRWGLCSTKSPTPPAGRGCSDADTAAGGGGDGQEQMCWETSNILNSWTQTHLIDVIHDSEDTGFSIASIFCILQEKRRQICQIYSAMRVKFYLKWDVITSALSTTTYSSTNLWGPGVGFDFWKETQKNLWNTR